MARTILIAALAAVLSAFTLAATACDGDGGGDALTLEEYFARFEEIDQNVDAEIEALFADFPEDDAGFFEDEENLPLVQELFAGFPRVLGDALDELRGVNPPSEVEEAHDEFLEAGDELLAVFEDVSGQAQDAETMAEIDTINTEGSVEIDPLQATFDSACLDIVDVATENDISIDVSCTDE